METAAQPQGDRPTPAVAARAAARRPNGARHAVTVKQDTIAPQTGEVFVRIDVTADGLEQAEERLRVAYSLAKAQLAAGQLAEQILAGQAVEQ